MTLHLRLKLQASAAGLHPGPDEEIESLERRLREKAEREIAEARVSVQSARSRRLRVAAGAR